MNVKDSIRRRLNRGFLIISIVCCIGLVISDIALFAMSTSYNHAMANYGFSQGEIGKAMTVFSEARSSLRAVIGYNETSQIAEEKKDYEARKESFQAYYANIEQYMVTKAGKESYAAIGKALEGYWTKSDSIMSAGSTTDVGASAKAQKAEYDELSPMYDEVYAAFKNLMDINVSKGTQLIKILDTLRIVLTIFIIGILATSVIASAKIGKRIAESIEKSIAALADRLKTFAEGDLDSEFPEHQAEDEIAFMNDEARQMAENLSLIINDINKIMASMANGDFTVNTEIEDKYVGKFVELLQSVRNMNRKMNATLKSVEESAGQVTAGSENLAQSAQDLAEGATEQAGAVEELQATITTITEQVGGTVNNLMETSKKAEVYASDADSSREDMKALMEAMERISDTSKKIENIIPVILRAPAHVTSPVTVPYISIEPVESRLPLTVKPFVITAVSAVPSFSSSLFGSSTPTALPISICAESFASSGSTLPLCLRVLTISSSEEEFFEKSLAVSFKSSLKSLKNPIRISSLG